MAPVARSAAESRQTNQGDANRRAKPGCFKLLAETRRGEQLPSGCSGAYYTKV